MIVLVLGIFKKFDYIHWPTGNQGLTLSILQEQAVYTIKKNCFFIKAVNIIFKFLAWNSTILKNSVEGPVCFFPTSVSLLSCASTWSMSCHFSLALLQLGLSHWVHKSFELAFTSSMRIQMRLNNVFSPIVACFVRKLAR